MKDALHAYVQNNPDLEDIEADLQDRAAHLEEQLGDVS